MSYNNITYNVDQNANLFSSNIFSENYATSAKGIVDVNGPPRLLIQNETFINNGESSNEIILLFGRSLILN